MASANNVRSKSHCFDHSFVAAHTSFFATLLLTVYMASTRSKVLNHHFSLTCGVTRPTENWHITQKWVSTTPRTRDVHRPPGGECKKCPVVRTFAWFTQQYVQSFIIPSHVPLFQWAGLPFDTKWSSQMFWCAVVVTLSCKFAFRTRDLYERELCRCSALENWSGKPVCCSLSDQ